MHFSFLLRVLIYFLIYIGKKKSVTWAQSCSVLGDFLTSCSSLKSNRKKKKYVRIFLSRKKTDKYSNCLRNIFIKKSKPEILSIDRGTIERPSILINCALDKLFICNGKKKKKKCTHHVNSRVEISRSKRGQN